MRRGKKARSLAREPSVPPTSNDALGVGGVEELERLMSRTDTQAAKSVPHVCANGVCREHEQLGDLGCCEPFAVKAEDCELTWSQAIDESVSGLLLLCAPASPPE